MHGCDHVSPLLARAQAGPCASCNPQDTAQCGPSWGGDRGRVLTDLHFLGCILWRCYYYWKQ